MTAEGGWAWTLNWGDIREDLVIGSCPMRTSDIDEISAGTGATALLSVQTDECRGAFDIDYDEHLRHARKTGLRLANAPMRDFDPPDQRVRLPAAVCALYRLLVGGHRVYVHCTAGINRSPLTVLAYLSFVEAMTPDQAMTLIHWGRPQAEPDWDSYNGCRADLVEDNRPAILRRAWELSQRNPAAAPDTNWTEAERQVIRDVFIADASRSDSRRDPHRG